MSVSTQTSMSAPLEALSAAPRWQRDLIAQRAGVSKAHVDTWARTGDQDIAGWIVREIDHILRPHEPQSPPPVAPTSTPFAIALRRAPFDKVKAIAVGLDIPVRELRKRVRDGWRPEPMARRQIVAILDAAAADVFPGGRNDARSDHPGYPAPGRVGPTRSAVLPKRPAYSSELRALEGLSDG
jgi:hypothetical protein